MHFVLMKSHWRHTTHDYTDNSMIPVKSIGFKFDTVLKCFIYLTIDIHRDIQLLNTIYLLILYMYYI